MVSVCGARIFAHNQVRGKVSEDALDAIASAMTGTIRGTTELAVMEHVQIVWAKHCPYIPAPNGHAILKAKSHHTVRAHTSYRE